MNSLTHPSPKSSLEGGSFKKKYAFMGSCSFSLAILEILHREGEIDFSVVLTTPPSPRGRGHKIQKTCVHLYAESQGWPVWTPSSLTSAEFQESFRQLDLDIAIVASYRFIVPQRILDMPRWGCINVHPSLLPRWRGASPVISTVLAGDTCTGVCLMLMDAGMDTGPLLDQVQIDIPPQETAISLSKKLAVLGGQRLLKILPSYMNGDIHPLPQSLTGITMSRKLTKEDAHLEWSHPAPLLDRIIRGFSPKAWGYIDNVRVSVASAQIGAPLPLHSLKPGHVIHYQGIWGLSCGNDQWIIPQYVTPEGGRSMRFSDFLRGRSLEYISL